MDLHANLMIFADEYCRATMPLAIPGGIACNHRMFNPDVNPARRSQSNPPCFSSPRTEIKIRHLADFLASPRRGAPIPSPSPGLVLRLPGGVFAYPCGRSGEYRG
jgi:hypothetical protein